MNCRLIQNIKHSCEYNPGGISEIYLLDIRDFVSYRFRDDKLYDQCFVDSIKISAQDYIRLDVVDESNFTENQDNGIYTQTITTFVRSLDYQKTASLLLAGVNKYLIVFSSQGKMFSFGSDGGATLSYTQQTGQRGETAGYSITITKKSIYPLFEAAPDKTVIESLLSTEDKVNLVTTEDGYCIPILELWKK
ncbi:MAG: hypothetical protein ACK5KL_20340 [Dysgonomonas sp.]